MRWTTPRPGLKGGTKPSEVIMSISPELRSRIQSLVDDNEVVLFMKGNRHQPQCGFSARAVGVLEGLVDDYLTVDVLSDPEVRQGIKVFSEWPTIPQLYIKGEFVGGSDIVLEAAGNGELHEMLGITLDEVAPPDITITPAAAERLQDATRHGQGALRFKIHPGFRYELAMGPKMFGDVEVASQGITLLIDRATAKVAEGTVIDFERQGLRSGFVISNPAEPKPVQQLSPEQLKAMIDGGEDIVIYDVRTPKERETAHIAGTILLDPAAAQALESQDRSTRLVFHCHHGMRSQQAAEYYQGQGFAEVYNLAGGIDAWSQQVDGGVPRY